MLIVPLLVCIAGLVLYLVATPPRPADVGKIMFGCGLLVTLLEVATHGIKLL